MKKISRILGIVLSMILIFGVVGTGLTACPNDDEQVTVKFMIGDTEAASIKIKSGTKIPSNRLPVDPKPTETQIFEFWTADGSTDFIANGKPTKDTTLTAKFRAREDGEWVVHFDPNGGSYVKSQVVNEGEKATQPAVPTKAGFTFGGWLNGTEAFDFDTVITQDYSLVANWTGGGDGKILVQSSGEFDKVFSPFFSTSAYDSSVHGQTQVSMLSADPSGAVYVGEDVPTVAKDFKQTIYYKDIVNPTDEDLKGMTPTEEADGTYRTEYEFVIKNGIKFSDGKDLTIKDVLFNLYVYLDPMYTGSSTMYSTNILGLKAYRMQDPTAGNDAITNDNAHIIKANERMDVLRKYYARDPNDRNQNRIEIAQNPDVELQMFKDLKILRENYWRELNSLWNSVASIEDVKEDFKEYGFTEHWEVFLLYLGAIQAEYENDGSVKVDEQSGEPKVNYGYTKEWYHDKDNLIKQMFNSAVGILQFEERGSPIKEENDPPKVDLEFDESGLVTGSMFPLGELKDKNNPNTLIGRFYDISYSNFLHSNVIDLTYGSQAGNELYTYMITEEKSKALEETIGSGVRPVESISGIDVYKADKFVNYLGQEKEYDEEHYVLRIKIAAVDPKAIWNFGFTVSPMHYYSNPAGKGTNFTSEDGYLAFNYPGIDGYDSSKPIHLGFKQLDFAYFNEVIKHPDILGVPMGAGPFKATNINGDDTGITPASFASDNLVHLKRNEYFYTTGENMNNVKFEFMKFQVIDTTKVLETLKSGQVHIGDPSATNKNVVEVQKVPFLTDDLTLNNGYGYVGVNAAKVPDLKIRQAIMTALNTDLIMDYYEGNLAQLITRPMSKVSWAYPEGAPDAYPFISRAEAKSKIQDLVEAAGYDGKRMDGGAYAKINSKSGQLTNLKFVFTIAGSSTDHPAYIMFTEAAALLNECGFNITVRNDAQALSKLANGQLEIWAAAWQSAIDPDMYQIYHKESQAQSVKNWGYPYLIDQGLGMPEELEIIEDLSKLIEDARKTLVQEERESLYAAALDKVMELAVEYPTYQRYNLTVYNNTIIDSSTLNPNPTPYAGLFNRIWEVSLL